MERFFNNYLIDSSISDNDLRAVRFLVKNFSKLDSLVNNLHEIDLVLDLSKDFKDLLKLSHVIQDLVENKKVFQEALEVRDSIESYLPTGAKVATLLHSLEQVKEELQEAKNDVIDTLDEVKTSRKALEDTFDEVVANVHTKLERNKVEYLKAQEFDKFVKEHFNPLADEVAEKHYKDLYATLYMELQEVKQRNKALVLMLTAALSETFGDSEKAYNKLAAMLPEKGFSKAFDEDLKTLHNVLFEEKL